MAGSLVAGAALGPVFDMLLKAVTEATTKVVFFKSTLNNIESTLSDLKPIFVNIDKLNQVLDRNQESAKFIHLLKKGEKLVSKCLKIKSWDIYHRYTYANKLDSFETSLDRFFQVFVQADLCLDSKRIQEGVKNIGEKLDKIKSLLSNGGTSSSGIVFSGGCNVPESLEYVVGLQVAIDEVKGMLLKNDEQIVVISAPGGCGKTTLAKHVCNDEQIKDRYNKNIFFVIVSKTGNPSLIVQKVFQSNNFQSDEDAINQLDSFFRKIEGPVLLVLDDVWSENKSFIDNFSFRIPGYKLLVTSRYMFPGVDTYKLNLLNEADAITLFKKFAFKDGTSHVRDHLVKKVVKSCGGFPLALKVVGRSLCSQPEVKWKQRIQKQSEAFFTTNGDILECLKPSIDAMEEKLRECFLDLAAFPEDQKIPASALRDMWVEIYDLNEEGADTVDYLLDLSIRNLVDLSLAREGACDIIDDCNGHFAMQHDLLRDLAIYLSSQEIIDQRRRLIIEIYRNQIPKWWIEQNQRAFQAHLLSISTDEKFSSTWCNMNLPSVKLLILNFCSKIYSLPQFIEGMSLLKVVIITNNGFSPAELSNLPSFGNLDNLKRIRLDYISFPSFYVPQLQSKNLQKISLITCEIGDAFNKCTLEISAMWPNLEEISIDYCHDLVELPVALCDLVHLKKLCISNCHELVKLPEEIGKLTKLEALRLHSCTRLSLLPESIGKLHKLRALDIYDCNGIDHLPTSIGELREIREINMKGCMGLDELPYEVTKLVQLERVICDEERASLWENYKRHLSNLDIEVAKQDNNLRWLHNSRT